MLPVEPVTAMDALRVLNGKMPLSAAAFGWLIELAEELPVCELTGWTPVVTRCLRAFAKDMPRLNCLTLDGSIDFRMFCALAMNRGYNVPSFEAELIELWVTAYRQSALFSELWMESVAA